MGAELFSLASQGHVHELVALSQGLEGRDEGGLVVVPAKAEPGRGGVFGRRIPHLGSSIDFRLSFFLSRSFSLSLSLSPLLSSSFIVLCFSSTRFLFFLLDFFLLFSLCCLVSIVVVRATR